MRYRIAYAETARADLFAIGDYVREAAGDETASRLVHQLISRIESLRVMPARHRVRAELHPELRALLVGNYIVFYRIMPDTVAVVRVLHGARNITADLFPD